MPTTDFALGERYETEPSDEVTEVRRYLDTPDWRLRDAGWTLIVRPGTRLLTASRGDISVEQSLSRNLPVTIRPGQLPPGPVTDTVSGLLGVRALTTVMSGTARITRTGVRNADAKLVAHIHRILIETADSTVVFQLIEVEPVRGYEPDGERIAAAVGDSAQPDSRAADEFEALAGASGLTPIAGHETVLNAEDPADHAVAQALLSYLQDLTDNVAGTIDDVDTEFLHDLRVAVRRIRSLLKRAGDVLPAALVEKYREEFRWVGEITTTTRDLDVFLLEMVELAGAVSDPDQLQPFADHLNVRRAESLKSLRSGLRSARFQELIDGFRDALGQVGVRRSKQTQAADFADDRLGRAYRRLARQAQALDAGSPAEQVHDLRKSGKDFRYLLEVFRPLCDGQTYQAVLKDLKRLQDVLGDFQDGEVQAAALRAFAQEMVDAGEQRADSLLAMGALSAHFEAEQRTARAELDSHHADYLGPQTARRVKELVRR